MFSRYLYSKVAESKTRFITLYLNKDEIDFLDSNSIPYYPVQNHHYNVDAEKLKLLFCH